MGVRVLFTRGPSRSGRRWPTPQTYTPLPGRVLGDPARGPTRGPSSGAACFRGPDPEGLWLKEAQAGRVAGRRWGGPHPLPVPRWGPCPAAPAPTSPPPQTPAHCFLQGGFVAGARKETFFMLCLFSPSALLRPRQRFIPGPRLAALGAGRARGGADGPIMDRAVLPRGPALPNPIHQERFGARVSANEAAGRSPRGLPSPAVPLLIVPEPGLACPRRSVGQAWEWAWRPGLRSPGLVTAGGIAGLRLALLLGGHGGPSDTRAWRSRSCGESQVRARQGTPACCPQGPHAKEFRAHGVSPHMCSGAKAVPFPPEARGRRPFEPETRAPCSRFEYNTSFCFLSSRGARHRDGPSVRSLFPDLQNDP